MYIRINGIDGAGKDAQGNLLKDAFEDTLFVFEPGGTFETDLIRRALLEKDIQTSDRLKLIHEVLKTNNIEPYTYDCLVDASNFLTQEGLTGRVEAYLYAAARCESMFKLIKPNVSKKDIIGLRSVACSMAYQGLARGLGMDEIWELNKPALDGIYPDLEIFLDLPPDVAKARLEKRTDKVERFDEEDIAFFNKVRSGYLSYYHNHCPHNFVIIDADNTVEYIHAKIKAAIETVKEQTI